MVQLRSLASGDPFNCLAAPEMCVCVQKRAVMLETQMTHQPQGKVVAMKERGFKKVGEKEVKEKERKEGEGLSLLR